MNEETVELIVGYDKKTCNSSAQYFMHVSCYFLGCDVSHHSSWGAFLLLLTPTCVFVNAIITIFS